MTSISEQQVRPPKCYQTLDLPAPPSCIEFSQQCLDYFVIGTYSLDKNEGTSNDTAGQNREESSETTAQSRSGSLLLFRREGLDGATLLQTVTTESAVLDIHFSPHDRDLLATAISTGTIVLSRLDPSTKRLEPCRSIRAFDSSILVLSLAWSPHVASKGLVACSLSNGTVTTLYCDDRSHTPDADVVQQEFEAHSLEAWTVTWSPDGSIVYSGGDDSVVRRWDPCARQIDDADAGERLPADDELERNLRKAPPMISISGALADSRTHQAGVTAILPLALEDHSATAGGDHIVTGSYDEFIRIVQAKVGRSWTTLAELRLGGGVWRLKLLEVHSADGDNLTATILASCMHAGPQIVQVRKIGEAWTIELVSRLDEHEGLNYGSDAVEWSAGRFQVMSTSFYEHRLCLHHYSDLVDTGLTSQQGRVLR